VYIADKNAFRVFWSTEGAAAEGGGGCPEGGEEGGEGASCHTLVAPDEHTKRQWVSTIAKAVASLDRTDQPANQQSRQAGLSANQQSRQAGLSANEKPAQPATPPKVRGRIGRKRFLRLWIQQA
jgi:hypothetical protein